tara:strand:+ start:762 stop:899 length:138 start_codon:yes stop_codon:yes gene_type:complete
MGVDMGENETNPSSEMWESPLGQSTYMFIWALASLASFAIFFKYF